jgi:hypothetical protein
VRLKTGSVGRFALGPGTSTSIFSSPTEFVDSGGACELPPGTEFVDPGGACEVPPGGIASGCIGLVRCGDDSREMGRFPSGGGVFCGGVDGGGANIEAMGQS